MNRTSPLRFHTAIVRFFAWFCALWFAAGSCFMLWCAFSLGTGRWKSDHPARDAAIFAAGSVFAALLAWLVVRVVLPHILRARDRQLEFIREYGGPRHAFKVFLFGEPGDGQSKQS